MRQKTLAVIAATILLASTNRGFAQNPEPNRPAIVEVWLKAQPRDDGVAVQNYLSDGKKTTIYFRRQKDKKKLYFVTCVQLDQGRWFCDPQRETSGRLLPELPE